MANSDSKPDRYRIRRTDGGYFIDVAAHDSQSYRAVKYCVTYMGARVAVWWLMRRPQYATVVWTSDARSSD